MLLTGGGCFQSKAELVKRFVLLSGVSAQHPLKGAGGVLQFMSCIRLLHSAAGGIAQMPAKYHANSLLSARDEQEAAVLVPKASLMLLDGPVRGAAWLLPVQGGLSLALL